MQSALGVSQGGVRIAPMNTDGADIESNTNNRSKNNKPHASPNGRYVGKPKPSSKRSSIASRLPVALHLHRGDRAEHSSSGEGGMSATSPLNSTKFDIASAITSSGFQETAACLEEISTKAAKIVEAQSCHVWLIDQTKHELYRLLPEGSANSSTSGATCTATAAASASSSTTIGEIRLIKPLDRGITASIVSEPSGFNTKNVATSGRWSHDIDERNAGDASGSKRETTSYLAWPLCDSASGECLGVIEFCNKCNGEAFFNAADSQLARIVAIQLANAIVYSRQQELLAGRNEAINKAYEEKSYDAAETICIDDEDDNDGDNTKGRPLVIPATSQQRSAFALPATTNVGGTTSGTPTSSQQIGAHAHNLSGMSNSEPTESMGCALAERGWEFDTFSQTEDELIQHAISIFDERGLLARFSIPLSTLTNFLGEIISGYRKETPYHNHHHCFDVLHVTYLLITRCKADEYLESLNVLSIFVAALAHDLGHDGNNNAFHAATESDLAVTYNGVSILENHSAAQLFRILKKEDCNILKRLNTEEQTKIRSRLIDLILDTDAKNHFMLCTRFKHGLEMKQLSRGLLSSMLLHIADVSNPSRPGPVARKWAFAVQSEFFAQGDLEKKLNLPRSPFMDRDFENLPRMQGAFIDAIVMPVFKLLAEFLPHVKDQCIKSLQLNRAFWNSLSSKGILKSTEITAYLERDVTHFATTIDCDGAGVEDENDDGSNSNDNGAGDNIDEGEESTSSSTEPMDLNQPIPGIPSNALQASPDARRVSLISLPHCSAHNLHNGDDPELGINGADGSATSKSKKRRRKGLKELLKACFRSIKAKMTAILESHSFQSIMVLATIYALFASDLSLVVGNADTDNTVDAVSFTVLLMFFGEMCSSAICIPKYMHFYFWLDLAATISLFLEIDFLLQWVSGGGGQDGNYDDGGTDQLSLAKASRAAKIGARAARLSRLLRLVRLIRVAKVVKWMLSNVIRRKNDKRLGGGTGDDDDDAAAEEVEVKMSVVGQRMTESITKKVIIAVLLTLLVFSLMDVSLVPDARQTGLDQLAVAVANNISDDGVASIILRDAFLGSHSESMIRFEGMGPEYDFLIRERFDSLRSIEMLSVYSSAMGTAPNSNSSLAATFDVSHEAEISAWYSIGTTLIVTVLLAALSLLLNRDAYRIMIRPIEHMRWQVAQLSKNPLLHLETMKKRGQPVTSETDMLELAISKMGRLLQVGFGSAGACIIAKSLSHGGDLDPMIPGCKVEAIFAFCDIRDFTFACEAIEEDVMLFVNKIASITHRHVVEAGGAPNKNIGDAFLFVWKLSRSKNGGRSRLQKELFDAALSSVNSILAEISELENLSNFLDAETDNKASWKSTLEDFQVRVGFGLHSGWAIEGSIGSKVKIDASYLSPHVNLASRLESATKQYHVPLLMSEDFVSNLTGSMQKRTRKVDRVTFKGSSEPMTIYHYDDRPYDILATTTKPSNYTELIKSTSWRDGSELRNAGVDITEVTNAFNSGMSLCVREVYDDLFNAFLDGKWNRCKILCRLWMERFPGDVIVHNIVEYLQRHSFECPPDWVGYHALTEK